MRLVNMWAGKPLKRMHQWETMVKIKDKKIKMEKGLVTLSR